MSSNIISFPIPPSTLTDQFGNQTAVQCCLGAPMVNSDGTAYVEYEVRNINASNVITSDMLYLMQIDTNNMYSSTLLSSTTQNEAQFPGSIIPDGQGGVLASWTTSPSNPPVPQYPYQIVDVAGGVVGLPYNLPFSPTTVTFGQSPVLVLGESGVVFATDSVDAVNGPMIASFNFSSGALKVNWSYQAAARYSLSIIASASGNGLVAKMTDQSANDTLLWFDPIGTLTTDTWSATSIQYADNEWLALSNSVAASARFSAQSSSGYPTAISDTPVPWADSPWLMPQQGGTAASEPAFTLEGQSDCESPTGRDIEYWLVNTQGRALVTAPYIVFEQQTDHTLAPPNGVSPLNYSGQQDKFSDEISAGTNTTPHYSTQTFNFGQQGQRLYPVRRIDRMVVNSSTFSPVTPPQFSIVVPPQQQATLNGQAAPYVGPCSGAYPPK
ncbi:MAG: hypothetical protein WBX38_10135 [Candidatus Sulfotelmatobacter sp.]